MASQLRIYGIAPGHLDEFVALDPDPAAWIVHQELLFVDESEEETSA